MNSPPLAELEAKSSPVAGVNPAIFRWAKGRQALSVAEVAAALQLPEAEVSSWESGESSPDYSRLEQLALIFHIPTAAFWLPEPPADPPPVEEFERLVRIHMESAYEAGTFENEDALDDLIADAVRLLREAAASPASGPLEWWEDAGDWICRIPNPFPNTEWIELLAFKHECGAFVGLFRMRTAWDKMVIYRSEPGSDPEAMKADLERRLGLLRAALG